MSTEYTEQQLNEELAKLEKLEKTKTQPPQQNEQQPLLEILAEFNKSIDTLIEDRGFKRIINALELTEALSEIVVKTKQQLLDIDTATSSIRDTLNHIDTVMSTMQANIKTIGQQLEAETLKDDEIRTLEKETLTNLNSYLKKWGQP